MRQTRLVSNIAYRLTKQLHTNPEIHDVDLWYLLIISKAHERVVIGHIMLQNSVTISR